MTSNEVTGAVKTPEIVVYSKPHCVQCTATYRKLDELNLEYTKADAETAESASLFAEVAAKFDITIRQAPVVMLKSKGEVVKVWLGYDPAELTGIVQS